MFDPAPSKASANKTKPKTSAKKESEVIGKKSARIAQRSNARLTEEPEEQKRGRKASPASKTPAKRQPLIRNP